MTDSKFPAAIIAAAQLSQKNTGCPASVTLAQWALESGYGKHCPPGSNNMFGIKWSGHGAFVETSTKEERHGVMQTEIHKFAKYDTLADGFAAHARLLTNPHGPYRSALPYIHDSYKFVDRIAHIYATDSAYGSKLRSIMSSNNLTEYDLKPEVKPATPPPAKTPAPAPIEPSKTETSK